MVINYSYVTNGPAEILKPYLDKDFREKLAPSELHSGVDIKCGKVYSISPGVVKLIGNSSGHPSVFISADDTNAYNYCHLKNVAVKYYDDVSIGTYLGDADEFVHFEYLNKQEGRWSFRIGTTTWYKHDPINVIENGHSVVAQPIITDVGQSDNSYAYTDTAIITVEVVQDPYLK